MGLRGADVAEQLCRNLGAPHERAAIVDSLDGLKFESMTLTINYRELNELTKFSMWCREEVGHESFHFINDDKVRCRLSKDRIQKLTECLWKWHKTFQSHVHYVPDECR